MRVVELFEKADLQAGAQGIGDALLRAKLPEELCIEVVEAAERRVK